MSVFLPLLRKQLSESRWSLGLTSAAFFAWAVFVTWRIPKWEQLIESGDVGPSARGLGFLRVLGGASMDYSSTALEVCWWNHPFIVAPVLGWVISRGAGAVAGEIERGTIDVTLSRPVSRSAYLASQVAFACLGLVAIVASLIAGYALGGAIFPLKAPPSVLTLLRPGAMVLALGAAVFGYTLPFSAFDVSRWRPALVGAAVTLGGLIAMSVAPLFPGYEWIKNLSVFQVYEPVPVALGVGTLGHDCLVLGGVFAVGLAVASWAFNRRDLPSNS